MGDYFTCKASKLRGPDEEEARSRLCGLETKHSENVLTLCEDLRVSGSFLTHYEGANRYTVWLVDNGKTIESHSFYLEDFLEYPP